MGSAATQARSPPSVMGLNGAAVRAPVVGLTDKTLSEALPSFTTNNRPFLKATCSEKDPGPPNPPLATGKPGRSVNTPTSGLTRNP